MYPKGDQTGITNQNLGGEADIIQTKSNVWVHILCEIVVTGRLTSPESVIDTSITS